MHVGYRLGGGRGSAHARAGRVGPSVRHWTWRGATGARRQCRTEGGLQRDGRPQPPPRLPTAVAVAKKTTGLRCLCPADRPSATLSTLVELWPSYSADRLPRDRLPSYATSVSSTSLPRSSTTTNAACTTCPALRMTRPTRDTLQVINDVKKVLIS